MKGVKSMNGAGMIGLQLWASHLTGDCLGNCGICLENVPSIRGSWGICPSPSVFISWRFLLIEQAPIVREHSQVEGNRKPWVCEETAGVLQCRPMEYGLGTNSVCYVCSGEMPHPYFHITFRAAKSKGPVCRLPNLVMVWPLLILPCSRHPVR